MPLSTDTITTDNINDTLESLATTYNTGIEWGGDQEDPFTPANFSPASNTSPAYTDAASPPLDSSISSGTITASTILTVFRSYASALSQIRKVRLVKYYNDNGTQTTSSDETKVTLLKPAYGVDMEDIVLKAPSSGAQINASNLNGFVLNLDNAISANRDDTVTFEEYYCHSSCHSSCHGSI